MICNYVTIPFLNESAVNIQMGNLCGLKLKFILTGLICGLGQQNGMHCVQKEADMTHISLCVVPSKYTTGLLSQVRNISMQNHKPAMQDKARN